MRHLRLIAVVCALVVTSSFGAGSAYAGTPTPPASQSEADTLRSQGIEKYNAGDYTAARDLFLRALDAYAAAGNRDGEARMLSNLGLVYEGLNDREAALERLRAARAIYAELKDAASEGRIAVNMARIEEDLGRKDVAESLYRESLPLIRAGFGPVDVAHVLAKLADLEQLAGKYEDALGHAQEALGAYRTAGEDLFVGTTSDLIGAIYVYSGNQAAGAASFAEARAAFKRSNQPAEEAGAARLEAEARSNSGELAAALAAFLDAKALYESTGDWDTAAIVAAEVAGLYHSLGNASRAEFYYQEGQKACAKGCTGEGRAALASEVCFFYSQSGDFQAAERECALFLTAAENAGPSSGRSAALENLADARRFAGKYQESLDAYSLAYYAYPAGSPRRPRIEVKAAWAYLGLGQAAAALEHARVAARLGEAVEDSGLRAVLLAGTANVFVALGETQSARQYGQLARDLFARMGDPEGEASALQVLGSASELAGEKDAAFSLYREAIALVEMQRENARADDLRQGVSSSRGDLYRSAVALAVELAKNQEAFELAERSRARAFLDRLGNQSLASTAEPGSAATGLLAEEAAQRDRLGLLAAHLAALRSQPAKSYDEAGVRRAQADLKAARQAYVDLLTRIAVSDPAAGALLTAAPPVLSAIQQKLDGDTSLLAYYVLPNQTLAFVVRRDGLDVVTLPVGEARLAELVTGFRTFSSLQNPQPAELAELSAALLEPLAGRLTTPQIGIIPHGVLHYVPFAALPLAEKGSVSLLGERHELFSLPSAGSLVYIQAKPLDGKILVVGEGSAEGLPVLRYAEQEAQDIAAELRTQPLLGKQATESAVRAGAPEASIIHIAGHGILSAREPLFSRLALAGDDKEDGNLEVHEIYAMRLPKTALVVLSACDTQPGLADAGDDVVGLNRAFLTAGASSVVATLWSVDEAASAALMSRFYRGLSAGMGKAQALAAAQAGVREDAAHPEWRHPYYWAAFVLSGDPGKTRPRSPLTFSGSAATLARLPVWAWVAAGLLLIAFSASLFGVLHRRRSARGSSAVL